MIQPDDLKNSEPLKWSTGKGTDAWALFCRMHRARSAGRPVAGSNWSLAGPQNDLPTQQPICVNPHHLRTNLLADGRGSPRRALPWRAAAQPHVLKWDIEATVYSITDPHKVFPDLRLGDTVRGTMAYNVNANRLWDETFNIAYFLHARRSR